MKIIISPSKTMTIQKVESNINHIDTLSKETCQILGILQSFDESSMQKYLKVNTQIANKLCLSYKNYYNVNLGYAIKSYTGTVFKQLNFDFDSSKYIEYLAKHLRILSALYGVLKPFELFPFHRLDMTTKLPNISLYTLWKESINKEFANEELIINLASKEFSKIITHPMITIEFIQIKEMQRKSFGMYNKMARGKLLNYCIVNQISTLDQLMKFSEDNYVFESYNKNKVTFVKEM